MLIDTTAEQDGHWESSAGASVMYSHIISCTVWYILSYDFSFSTYACCISGNWMFLVFSLWWCWWAELTKTFQFCHSGCRVLCTVLVTIQWVWPPGPIEFHLIGNKNQAIFFTTIDPPPHHPLDPHHPLAEFCVQMWSQFHEHDNNGLSASRAGSLHLPKCIFNIGLPSWHHIQLHTSFRVSVTLIAFFTR